MKRYCVDTSGFSHPHERQPPDIYVSLWREVSQRLKDGIFAVTPEIYDEMTHITGDLGNCITDGKKELILEIGGDWDSESYIAHSTRMNVQYRGFISEYLPGLPKKTICLNDMTIVALAKALNLPLVSMESSVKDSPKYQRIPDICKQEGIVHMDFNDFLRAEGIKV